ncbi:DegT/DnrJ/EryC1/StrS aminotransferase family protein [uncultured Oscillibacter sp.]|uniref:DegT/DnrJ/EryC1/StrS family aminotransferase n=1 Tax=uncultured Oscillibacter sp. TaxID=876091 RepID=UPI0025F050D4|nr:DegT/DnrJ/EryC1/StrS aminotransferase family protein [uncultured Oscillibacter sp.]
MRFIDLEAQYQALKADIDANIQSVLGSAQFIGGPYVQELEARLAAFTGRKHCITCANGTDALQLAFLAAGVGAGDAVFCPDMTFISSTEPAKMSGAASVFCDILPDTYCLSPESLERQIEAVLAEGRLVPKAVVAVDILGSPCDYDAIGPICQRYGLTLIEDAAQSFGASYHGRRAGAFGHIATTSFFPAKPLGCYGDGGAVFTDDDGVDALCRSLCVHGKGPGGKYDNIRIGMNSRLDSLQAAILLPKLKALEDYELDARQAVAARYSAAFAGEFTTPFVAEGCVSAWAQYALLAKDAAQRDRITAHLTARGIPNMVYYPKPQHALPVFRDEPSYGETFRSADDYCARTFSLPMHPYLTEAEQDEVIRAVWEAV